MCSPSSVVLLSVKCADPAPAVEAAVNTLVLAAPVGSLIVNTLNGDTNTVFFNKLYALGNYAGAPGISKFTILSFSVGEPEVAGVCVWVCLCVCVRECEREREREKGREKEREKESERERKR